MKSLPAYQCRCAFAAECDLCLCAGEQKGCDVFVCGFPMLEMCVSSGGFGRCSCMCILAILEKVLVYVSSEVAS